MMSSETGDAFGSSGHGVLSTRTSYGKGLASISALVPLYTLSSNTGSIIEIQLI